MALAVIAHETHEVTALIVNHNLRRAAKAEAKRASQILTKAGIKNEILEYKGKAPKANVQEAARKLRYELLIGYCKKNGIDFLATAHHADDNAENFLLRLARGSGVDGLSSMKESMRMDGITLIRPLLKFSKTELEKYLKTKKVKWVEDATNKTSKYKRNSLRHALEKVEDRDLITKRINDASQSMSRVRNFLEAETAKAEKTVVNYSDKAAELDTAKFAKLHEEIAFRLLSKVISRLSPKPKKPRFSELQTLKNALLNGQKKTLSGLVFSHKYNNILITIEK